MLQPIHARAQLPDLGRLRRANLTQLTQLAVNFSELARDLVTERAELAPQRLQFLFESVDPGGKRIETTEHLISKLDELNLLQLEVPISAREPCRHRLTQRRQFSLDLVARHGERYSERVNASIAD